jgi:hypothetical protein
MTNKEKAEMVCSANNECTEKMPSIKRPYAIGEDSLRYAVKADTHFIALERGLVKK